MSFWSCESSSENGGVSSLEMASSICEAASVVAVVTAGSTPIKFSTVGRKMLPYVGMSVSQSERSPVRKRAAHRGPERRRPLVLDAAHDLFLSNGFEGTSMDAIAAAAGVSKPV